MSADAHDMWPGHDDDAWALRINAFLDDEQGDDEHRAVEEHLASCATCSLLREELERLKRLFAADPTTSPSPRVLAAILQRAAARRPRRLQPVLIGIAAALLVLLGGLVAKSRSRPAPSTSATATARNTRVPEASISADVSYRAEAGALEATVASRRARLGPTARTALDESLRALDRALTDAEVARSADPHNAMLAGYVRTVREHRLAVLRAAVAVHDDSAL